MKRGLATLVALACLGGACGNTDRYAQDFGSSEPASAADLLATFGGKAYASGAGADGRIEVTQGNRVVWVGPPVKPGVSSGHIAFDRDGNLLIAVGTRVLQLDRNGAASQKPTVVSDGWVNPNAFTVDARNRLWVADEAPRGGKAFVARGKENNRAKRRRFATALPAGSIPSAVAVVKDEVYVCRSVQRDVFRLHVGLDNVARRRGVVPGLKCENGIASLADGSLVTSTGSEIRRYRAR